MAGKIVAIIGPMRCGKSYLTKKLAEHYGVPYFLEGEEADMPASIIEDMRKNTHPVERFRYFRDISVANHIAAEKLVAHAPIVFIDTFWFNNAPWIGIYDASDEERAVMRGIFASDAASLPRPAFAVYLKANVETSKRLAALGGRTFEEDLEEQMIKLKSAYGSFMVSSAPDFPFTEIDRSGLDFDRPEDLRLVVEKIDAAL